MRVGEGHRRYVISPRHAVDAVREPERGHTEVRSIGRTRERTVEPDTTDEVAAARRHGWKGRHSDDLSFLDEERVRRRGADRFLFPTCVPRVEVRTPLNLPTKVDATIGVGCRRHDRAGREIAQGGRVDDRHLGGRVEIANIPADITRCGARRSVAASKGVGTRHRDGVGVRGRGARGEAQQYVSTAAQPVPRDGGRDGRASAAVGTGAEGEACDRDQCTRLQIMRCAGHQGNVITR